MSLMSFPELHWIPNLYNIQQFHQLWNILLYYNKKLFRKYSISVNAVTPIAIEALYIVSIKSYNLYFVISQA